MHIHTHAPAHIHMHMYMLVCIYIYAYLRRQHLIELFRVMDPSTQPLSQPNRARHR